MRIITKLFVAVLACMAITFAQTSNTTKQATTTLTTQQAPKDQGKLVTPILPKAPTNWTKIKDLFL